MVTTAASSLTVIGFLGLLAIILGIFFWYLLSLVITSIPIYRFFSRQICDYLEEVTERSLIYTVSWLSTPVSSQCAPPPICDNTCLLHQPLCRANGLDWEEMKDGNTSRAHNIHTKHQSHAGSLFIGKFLSKDKQLHLTTIQANGTISNGGDADLPIKILRNFARAPFSYIPTWPGSLLSAYHRGSPDLREAILIVGLQDGQKIYFGKTPSEPYRYGTVALSENKLTYELRYADEHNKQQRTNVFLVLIADECNNIFRKAFPGENIDIRKEMGPRIAQLIHTYYEKDTT